MLKVGIVILVLAGSLLAIAESSAQQPYAALEGWAVKALSEQQIADLRAGRGMGLALAAELNGYPGPLHVIELAKGLDLTDLQLASAHALFDAMKAETVPIGVRLIEQEAELDKLFASRTITPETLGVATAAIGDINATLRAAHLKYHLAMLDVLRPSQVLRYSELRGYSRAAEPHSGQHDHRP
jgi:hypothetical protein